MMSELALAEPVPLTLANLTTKSLTRSASVLIRLGMRRPPHRSHAGCLMVDFCISQAAVGQRSAHRPQCTQTSSSLTMTRPVCGSASDTYSGCVALVAGAFSRDAQFGLGAVGGDRETVDRADVDAGIALDAQLGGEHRLHVAVQAALHLQRRLLRREAQLHLDVDLLEALDQVPRAAPAAARRRCIRSCRTTRACPFCGCTSVTPRGMRSVTGSSRQYLWIEMAA